MLPCARDYGDELRQNRVSMVVVEVDDGLNGVVVIDESDVAADRDIPVVGGRVRQLAREIRGCWMHFAAQVLVEYCALVEA